MISLIYVSRCQIDPADRSFMLEDIQAVSLARNTMLGITGVLIVAPGYFAQLIEGPEPDVAALMSRIIADPRHTGCRVVRRLPIGQARYPYWRLVRFDCGNFGYAAIEPLLTAAHTGATAHAVPRLEQLIGTITGNPATARKLVSP